MDSIIKDIRYGFRSLLKRPGFTAIALVALALGIGANTAIFSLVNAVVLQPLPYPEPDRLVWVFGNVRNGTNRASVAPLDFLDFRSQNKTFEQFAASSTITLPANLTGNGEPERLNASAITGNYFNTFGVVPALGRGFTLENEKPSQDQVTVLTHALWQRRFGGDPAIIDKTIILDGKAFQVIGVMAADVTLPQRADLWVPLNFDSSPDMKQRFAHFLRPIGRLKQGVTLDQAQADTDLIAAQIEQQFPESNTGWNLRLVSLREQLEAAGFVTELPLSGQPNDMPFTVEGRPPVSGDQAFGADFRRVNQHYFNTLRIPLLRGRNFTEQEVRQGDKVLVVSQQLVDVAFPNEEALGKRLITGIRSEPYEIIGIVGDIRHRSLAGNPFATMYFPTRQPGGMNLVIRTQGDPLNLVGAVRKEVQALDPDQPIAAIRTMSDWVDSSVAAPRYRTTLLTLFAALAMILAATGIYGVMSYSVAQRTHEIGVRMALGARQFDVLKLVVRQGMFLTLIGVVLGLGGAFALTRVMSTLLFGVTSKDPLTFGVVAALLIAVAFVACFVPARRATKVDPLVALRYE